MDFLDNRLNKWILPNYTFFLQKKICLFFTKLKKKLRLPYQVIFLFEYRKH